MESISQLSVKKWCLPQPISDVVREKCVNILFGSLVKMIACYYRGKDTSSSQLVHWLYNLLQFAHELTASGFEEVIDLSEETQQLRDHALNLVSQLIETNKVHTWTQ